ncbi:MAG: uroporphyrinogen decarboxylase family protein [Candidatus Humimicrobiaceae bacterium]
MNSRERFNSIMNFDLETKNLKCEYGYWATTVLRFIDEGMPVFKKLPENLSLNGNVNGYPKVDPNSSEVPDENIRKVFGLDPYVAKMPFDISPQLKEEIISEDEHFKVYKDKYGITLKARKDGASPPLDLDFPIKNDDDFEAYKSYYDNDFKKRLPKDWENIKKDLKNRDFPLRLGGNPYGFLGFPRHLMGMTSLFMTYYDNPKLVKKINEFFLDYVMDYWNEFLSQVEVDCILIFEDMAFKSGSLVSKEIFEEFMKPYYLKLIDFLKQYGIKNIIVDSDGYVEELIPLFIDCGVTGMLPFEIAAGNDIIRIRKDYPEFQLLGGIDKKILFADKGEKEINLELEKIKVLLGKSGYIPHIDHLVSEDATWKNFSYYRNSLNRIIDEKNY